MSVDNTIEDNQNGSEEQPTASSGGPTRAKGRSGGRPPTAFALAPVKLDNPMMNNSPTNSVSEDDFSDTTPTEEEEEGDSTSETDVTPKEEKSEELPKPEEGPTRAKTSAAQRPPTTFVNTPIKPNLAPQGGPRRAAPVSTSRPGTAFIGKPMNRDVNPAFNKPIGGGDSDLIAREKKEGESCQNLKVNTNELLQYQSADEIWSRSSAAATLRKKLDNVYVLEQLFICLVDPKKCTLFSSLSSGLGESRIQELHNKMKCVSSQLLKQINTPDAVSKIFRHNILDKLYMGLLSSPAPINDLSAYYMREIISNLSKLQKEQFLRYLTAKPPSQQKSRASFMFDHFYSENITFLFDECLTLEEEYVKQQNEKGGPNVRGAPPGIRGGRGGPGRGGPPLRGAGPPRGRGGPPRGRGGPPRGRGGPSPGRGTPRGAPGARGGPPRGRGSPGPRGNSPASGRPADAVYRFSKTFNLEQELRNQFFGGNESGNDDMIPARSQLRSINTAHIYQGLLFRGWDFPTISGILKNLGEMVDKVVEGEWLGIEVIENRVKVLVAILKYINKQWNPSTPRGKLVKDAADVLIKDRLCNGSIKRALNTPPKQSILPALKFLKADTTCGALRTQLITFLSFNMLIRFLDSYAKDIINSGVINTSLDLFFKYPHNFFLHEVVSKNLISNVLKCRNDDIFVHLFTDCKLLERIMDNFQPVTKPRTKDPNSYVSYNGHLVMIANMIDNSNHLKRAGLESKLSCISKWNSFVSGELKQANQNK